jgi:dihydropyrimidinase
MSILIRNGRVITSGRDFTGDVFIEGSRISSVGQAANVRADRTIDAAGKLVIPGGIDAHTHLNMPLGDIFSTDDFETGTMAAAFGGTTTVIDFATQSRGQSLISALEEWHKKAGGRACVDYGFHMIIVDLPEERLPEMDECIRRGVTTFKMFMAYPGALMVDDATITRALRRAKSIGGLVQMHAEDGRAIDALVRDAVAAGKLSPEYHALTRPPETEAAAITRTIRLAEAEGAPVYIVHVSSADGMRCIAGARSKGLTVYGETCPQYLVLSLDDIRKPQFEGAKFVFTPPVRDAANQEPLWSALADNTLQVAATDHCPFNFIGQKDRGKNDFRKIPNGGPGIENRLHILYHHGVNKGRMPLTRWVDVVATAPAKIFGLYPRKGVIAPGSDADIVIWNPDTEWTISAASHHMRVDYSMYEGMPIRGKADIVISRGEVIVENDHWLGTKGRGKYLERQPMMHGITV